MIRIIKRHYIEKYVIFKILIVIESKYFQKEKIIEYNGQKINIFERLQEVLSEGKLVLFIGVGCDIYALECYLKIIIAMQIS